MKTQTLRIPERYRVLLTLAQLLERFERRLVPGSADQYRSVVAHLSQELAQVKPGEEFEALLGVFPATAELYENLQYRHAGLCRSPLEASMEAELRTRELFDRLQR